MGFKKINPRRIHSTTIRKSAGSQKVLDALNAYIEDNSNEPMRWLVRMWDDEQHAFTYEQLRQIVAEETSPQAIFDKWFEDYSNWIKEKMTPQWKQGFIAGATNNPKIQELTSEGLFEFTTSSDNVRNWILNRTGQLITACTDDQIQAVRYIIAEARSNGLSSAETARYIRPMFGLNRPQAAANLNFYNTYKEQMKKDHPRMTDASIEKKARDAAAKYAGKQQRYRALMIARTENAYAYNEGNDEAIRQAQAQNLLPKMRKVWSCAPGERTCPECADLDGVEVGMDDRFSVTQSWWVGKYPSRTRHYGTQELSCLVPPLHPNCRCAILYEEDNP